MTYRGRMDSRKRGVDRRRFTRIAVLFGAGAALVLVGVLLSLVVPNYTDGEYHRYEEPEGVPIAIGAILMIAAAGDLMARLVKGPQAPGKRARE